MTTTTTDPRAKTLAIRAEKAALAMVDRLILLGITVDRETPRASKGVVKKLQAEYDSLKMRAILLRRRSNRISAATK